MPLSLLEIALLRATFSKLTAELIECYFVFDRERALTFQAGLVAVKLKMGRDFNAFAVFDEANLAEKITDAGIGQEQMETARAEVDAEDKSGVLRDVPPIGEIGVRLKMVQVRSKDLLMQAQAAVRVLDMVESTFYNAHGNQRLRLNEVVYDLKAESKSGQEGVEPKYARSFIGRNSPKVLTQAQALNHLADLVSGVMAATSYKSSEVLRLLEIFAVSLLESAKTISDDVEAIGSATLNRDLTVLYERANYRIVNFENTDLSQKGVREEKLSQLSDAIHQMFETLEEKHKYIEGARLEDLAELIEHRFKQIAGIQVAVEIGGRAV